MNTQTEAPEITTETVFVAELLWTDTRVWEIIARTAKTLTLRHTGYGETVKSENRDGNPYPCVWTEAVSQPDAGTKIVRLRKDGTGMARPSSIPSPTRSPKALRIDCRYTTMTHMNPGTYTVAGLTASERLGNHPDTCSVCGREDLLHPVKLAGPAGIEWVGTSCAANLLYGRTDKVALSDARRCAREATDAVADEERAAARVVNEAKAAAWFAWLDEKAGPGEPPDQFTRLGGYAEARAAFRAETAA